MRVRFIPQRKEFFDLFSRASSNAVDIARLLVELLNRYPQDGAELIARIKDHEHTGDELTHETVTLINKTFVTPFDRDDIYRLATVIDDGATSSTRPPTTSARGACPTSRRRRATWRT